MTEERKNNLISKMLESPAALSDSEIMQILEDEELRDIYSLSVDIKAAKENQTEINPSAEWNMFRSKLMKPRRWNVGLLSRVAAILVGVLLVSAALFFMTNKETSIQEPKYAQNDNPDLEDIKITESLTNDTISVPVATLPEQSRAIPSPLAQTKPLPKGNRQSVTAPDQSTTMRSEDTSDDFIEITDPEEARQIMENIGNLLAVNFSESDKAMNTVSASIESYKEITKTILQ